MSIFDPKYRDKHVSARIARALFRISQATKNMLWDECKLKSLTPAQIQTLLFIRYIRPDSAIVNTLAKSLSSTPATASGVLDALQKKSLVRRKRKESDRRVVSLSLTSNGTNTVQKLEGVGYELQKIIEDLTVEEQEVLLSSLSKIERLLREKGYALITETCPTCCYFRLNIHLGAEKSHYCKLFNIDMGEDEIYRECPEYRELEM